MAKSEKTRLFEEAMKELGFNFDTVQNPEAGMFADIDLSDLTANESFVKKASQVVVVNTQKCSEVQIEEKPFSSSNTTGVVR